MPCFLLLPRSQDLLLLLGQATFTLPFLTQLKCHLLQNAFLDLVPSGSYSISLLIPQQFLSFSLSQDGSTWRRYGVIPCTRPELNTCNPMPAWKWMHTHLNESLDSTRTGTRGGGSSVLDPTKLEESIISQGLIFIFKTTIITWKHLTSQSTGRFLPPW